MSTGVSKWLGMVKIVVQCLEMVGSNGAVWLVMVGLITSMAWMVMLKPLVMASTIKNP